MSLEGTIKTPFGPVQKKTALVFGGGVAVLGVIVWYRQKQLGDTGNAVDAETAINPATGYPYGSPEDAAALSDQAAYVSPTVPSGGGSGIPPSNVGYSSNGQWVQAVIEYMVTNGLIDDGSLMAAALGKYTTGAYATDSEVSLIQQAIAVQGMPPVAGPTGYPPSINRNPPTTTTPSPTGTVINPPTSLHLIKAEKTALTMGWTPAPSASNNAPTASYRLFMQPGGRNIVVAHSPYRITGLKAGTRYSFQVAAIAKNGTQSRPSAYGYGTTKK